MFPELGEELIKKKKKANKDKKGRERLKYNFMVCKRLAGDSSMSHILSICQDILSVLIIPLHPY